MPQPIRVLQVLPAMNAGGMETFVMNLYRCIDRTKVQFDFIYHYDMPCFYDAEIQALGGRIHRFDVRQTNNLPAYLRGLRTFFAQHPEYRVIHGHYSGFGMFYNPIAKQAGITVRAGHSHSTNHEKTLVGLLDWGMSRQFSRGLTHRFACGIPAGKALFGKDPFVFLPNGIDAARFGFDPAARQRLRAQLGVQPEERLYGHVGRFTQAKNHAYLLEIFAKLCQVQPAKLVLLGEGSLMEPTRALAQSLGIADRVLFEGVRTNTAEYYSAMDAFLLPSLFEGLPMVLVEAQAAGLPCFVSQTVDAASDLCHAMQFLPLQNSDAWVAALQESTCPRNENALEQVRAAGYDMTHTAQQLQQFYLHEHEYAPARG